MKNCFKLLWKVIYWAVKKLTLKEYLHEFEYMTIFAQKQLP